MAWLYIVVCRNVLLAEIKHSGKLLKNGHQNMAAGEELNKRIF